MQLWRLTIPKICRVSQQAGEPKADRLQIQEANISGQGWRQQNIDIPVQSSQAGETLLLRGELGLFRPLTD